MEVSTFIYPYTSWTDSFIHTAFECAGATLSGVEAAYKSIKKQGKLSDDKHTKFIAFGGDGGTYDIGLTKHYQEQWKEDTTWYMYATIMEHI